MGKRSKHEPTDSYFYLARQFDKCTTRLNSHVGPVRTKMNNTQNMNIYKKNTQNIPDSHVCYSDKIKSKRINVDETVSNVCYKSESKSTSVIVDACATDKRKSKRVHISVNTSEVKGATNKAKDEETSIIDNSVINAPRHFELFECCKNFLKNIDATYEHAYMANSQEKWDMEKLRYGRV